MTPYFEQDGVRIFLGDCREILPTLMPGSFDAAICDPPYGLNFMGKAWDKDVAFNLSTWANLLQVLKPGAHLLAFGGTRTHHRLMCAIEDGGFELRDTLMWVFGSGFPKSLDISKAIDRAAGVEREVISEREEHNICRPAGGGDERLMTSAGNRETRQVLTTAPATDAAKLFDGYGTALKPAYEPVVLAMAPLDGTFASNAVEHGVAGLNINGSRIESAERPLVVADRGRFTGNTFQGGEDGSLCGSKNVGLTDTGRWPANLILDEEAAAALDEQSGELTSGNNPATRSADKHRNVYANWKGEQCLVRRGTDSGGASRFFYTAKADSNERGTGNIHPTVKPLDLMRHLCKLVCPPKGGALIDSFMGSGSTLLAGRSFFQQVVGIELDEKYCEIAARRLSQHVMEFA